MFELFALTASTSSSLLSNKGVSLALMVAMFAAMYFFMIRPQKKKQKQEQEMRETIQIGDEITTIGGLIAKVVTVKDDSLTIETGADRTKLKIARWAIQTNNTSNERMDAERKAAEQEKNSQREQAAIDDAVNGRPKKKKKVLNRDSSDDKILDISDAESTESSDAAGEEADKDSE